MGNYDKLVMSPSLPVSKSGREAQRLSPGEESEKIWKALNSAMGMKPDQVARGRIDAKTSLRNRVTPREVTADAEAVAKYASLGHSRCIPSCNGKFFNLSFVLRLDFAS